MRIWHERLIPCLCRQHLLASWREGLGAYKIITQDKKGYRNHPAVKEFEMAPAKLYERLNLIRSEMLRRGYNPKPLPQPSSQNGPVNHWQSLKQQLEILKAKGCSCQLEKLLLT